MKILLIGINFGNYEKRIVNMLESQGHEVFYMYDSSEKYSIYLRVFGEKYTKKITRDYQNKMLKKMTNSYDRVIVIVGRQLNPEFLDEVKKNNPNARYVLYLWDDVKRVENFEKTKHIYDEIYSFDLKDCRDYGFKHLPLFFSMRPDESKIRAFDLYSAMFSHSDREYIIATISNQAKQWNLKSKFYISLGRFEYFKRMKEIQQNNDENIIFVSKPINEEINYKNMNDSKIILDVQFAGQIGLTMRTIESLGMKNKIITTNQSIVYYDFYDDSNILVIDRNKPKLSDEFVYSDYKPIKSDIYEKYSLETWTKTLTGEIVLKNYIGQNKIHDLNL